jgi:hypothetical protein
VIRDVPGVAQRHHRDHLERLRVPDPVERQQRYSRRIRRELGRQLERRTQASLREPASREVVEVTENVAGSFVIGVLAALVTADGRPALGVEARAFFMVGILGGFTTFSSFSLETLELARSGPLSERPRRTRGCR